MRYLEPDTTRLGRVSFSYHSFGEGIPSIMVGVGSIFTGIVGVGNLFFYADPMWLFMILPLIITATLFVSWHKHSVMIGPSHRDCESVEKANAVYSRIRGSYTEDLAKPILRKIYTHAQTGHNYWNECKDNSCYERIKVMKELIPSDKSALDKSDVQQALDWIKARKELEG